MQRLLRFSAIAQATKERELADLDRMRSQRAVSFSSLQHGKFQ
jgi:hypothetical protein